MGVKRIGANIHDTTIDNSLNINALLREIVMLLRQQNMMLKEMSEMDINIGETED